jgi:hypothetical protein
MERAREALEKLPRQRRINQMCLIEAVGQIGHVSSRYHPDAIVADALAPTAASGLTLDVPGGAFRSDESWYGVAFHCTVTKDLFGIAAFTFRIGDALPGPPTRATNGPAKKAGGQ